MLIHLVKSGVVICKNDSLITVIKLYELICVFDLVYLTSTCCS